MLLAIQKMKKGERWGRKYRKLMKKIMARKSYKEKISLASKKMWRSPRIRKRIILGIRRIAKDVEHRKRLREIWTKERRKEQSLRKKKLYELSPEIKRKIAEKLKERYRNKPYLRIKLSREKQEYYEKNPEARENLLKYYSSGTRSIKALGVVVKSEGEKIINDILFNAGIKPGYEQVELNFPEMDPNPDFFPSGKCEYGEIGNVFLEFYGGFPGTRTRNIRKKQLYEKYKVPVLIITPAELKINNFKDYLLRELVRLSRSKQARNFRLSRWELRR